MEPMDEDLAPPRLAPPGQHVHFGEIRPINAREMVEAGIAAGNIFTQAADAENLELPAASAEELHRQQELVREIELRRRMKATVVPTNDQDVRRMLRQLREPVTLFGEREMERRDRLRKMLADMGEERAVEALGPVTQQELEEAAAASLPPSKEIFYTEGGEQLRAVRLEIAQFSLQRAARRIAAAKRKRESGEEREGRAAGGEVERHLRAMTNQSSEIGDERPVAAVAFSPDGSQLATGAWSGTVKLWRMPNCQRELAIKAHAERITGLAWHPEASTSGRMEEALALASGATDGVAKLWSAGGKLLRTLSGHTDRLGRLAFHPMGRHLGTTSFDFTWRLWDCETGACVVEQEGHSRAVYSLAFQCDGSLAASGGMDAVGRIWDVRSGRNIMTLEGHVKAILALDFSPCGYQLASGSEDNTARVWDLRKRGTLAILPGHTSLISQVRFEPGAARYLLTAGYDNTCRLWSGQQFKLTRTLAGHEGKVMSADVSPAGDYVVATGGYDRTIKLYAPDVLALDTAEA